MISTYDWKMRFWTQEVLNFLGRKFGLTKAGILINLAVVHLFTKGYIIWETSSWFFKIFFGIDALIIVGLAAIFVQLGKSKAGEDMAWEIGKFFRFYWLAFFPLKVILTIGGIFDASNFNFQSEALAWLAYVTYGAILWVGACIEAPPKEKKFKKPAFAAN